MSRVCMQLGFALNFNTLEVEAAVRVNSKRRVLEAESQWSWMAFRRGLPLGREGSTRRRPTNGFLGPSATRFGGAAAKVTNLA